ncbi:MAG: O-antigen ligase family protein, partial [Candidatus Latescibacterota bacterium]
VPAVAFSEPRAVLLLLLGELTVPQEVVLSLRLPAGLRLQEVLFLVAALFAVVDLACRRDLRWPATGADLCVAVFLLATATSVAVGYLHGNDVSVIWRDARFPCYYGAFFLVTGFVGPRFVLRSFAPALVVGALVVSAQYILEFLGTIDLSAGERFVRVARHQGVSLPIALLFLVNEFMHHPRRFGRWPLAAAFAPISLALVLTVGRGMWVAFGAGVVVSTLLWHLSRPVGRRRPLQAALLALATVVVTVGVGLLFQRATGSSLGAHAAERSRTFADVTRDVHALQRMSSYLIAWEAIGEHPVLGNGQGKTLVLPIFNEDQMRFADFESWSLDNLYLALALKMGAVGLLAFGWMGARILRLAWSTFRQTGLPQVRAFAGGAVAVLAAMAMLGLTDAAMVNGSFAVVFGILFGGVAVVAAAAERASSGQAWDGAAALEGD